MDHLVMTSKHLVTDKNSGDRSLLKPYQLAMAFIKMGFATQQEANSSSAVT
jgi:hypothetical protein